MISLGIKLLEQMMKFIIFACLNIRRLLTNLRKLKLMGIKLSHCLSKGAIKWNFTKFLVDKEGEVVARFSPTYKPEDIADKIEELI